MADDDGCEHVNSFGRGEQWERSESEKDEHDEPDQGERLGEGDAQEHRGTDHPGRFWLAGHRLDGFADDDADADAGADGRQAVGETSACWMTIASACMGGVLLLLFVGWSKE
jgi:hypothetical protein